MEKTFAKEEWIKVLQALRERYRIFVPVRDGDFHSFKPLDEEKGCDFSFQNTRLSPKSIVYPQAEKMFEYSLDEKEPGANIYREVAQKMNA